MSMITSGGWPRKSSIELRWGLNDPCPFVRTMRLVSKVAELLMVDFEVFRLKPSGRNMRKKGADAVG